MNQKARPFYYYVAFVATYLVLTIVTRPNKAILQQYHISESVARLLSISVALPLIGIWFAAFYGFAKLNGYARLIKKHEDGQHVATIARGLTWLAISLPVGACVSAALNLVAQHHSSFLSASGVISGYVNLLIPLVGFSILGAGARGLVDYIKQRPAHALSLLLALFLAVIGVVYCYFIFSDSHIRAIYHMPVWVLMFTIVVPYLFMWFMGLLAATELFTYATKAPGVVYRNGWKLLAAGLGAVIASSIAIQYLVTLTNRLSRLKIGALLAIIYLLLLVLASGYIAIALGAKKLQKIEEA